MPTQQPAKKQTIPGPTIIGKIVSLAATTGLLFLVSCASSPKTPPPPGSAIIDAKPNPDFRKGVAGIALVSINGGKVQGTRRVIKPGLNSIKVRFNWPRGKDQQADLRFYATPDTVYTVHYEVYPPHGKFKSTTTQKLLNHHMTHPAELLIIAPIAGLVGVGERIVHGTQKHESSYVDLVVVAHLSMGTVRKIRVFPDGRVETKPWSSWAQMKAPKKLD